MDWRVIYDRESPALLSYLLARGVARDRAEDIVHEVFSAAIASRREIERPRAYLFRSVRRALAPHSGELGVNAPTRNDVVERVVLEPSDRVDERQFIEKLREARPIAPSDGVRRRIFAPDVSTRSTVGAGGLLVNLVRWAAAIIAIVWLAQAVGVAASRLPTVQVEGRIWRAPTDFSPIVSRHQAVDKLAGRGADR